MKDKLISDRQVINAILDNKELFKFPEDIQRFAVIIEDLPPMDRPQGEWIDIGTISHSYKCSVCGRTLFHITVGKNHVAEYYPYCHCGARMKGADDGH